MYKLEDFTQLRLWDCGEDAGINLDDVENVFKELADAIGNSEIFVWQDTIDARKELGNSQYPVFYISNKNSKYLPIFVVLFRKGKNTFIAMGASGKGEQVKAPDLQKLYVRASGSVYNTYSKIKPGANRGRGIASRFGMSGTSGAIGAGVAAATGAAVAGSIKLAAKGIRVLMRDKEAYEKEMGFYTFVLGMGDYLIGRNDSNDCFGKIIRSAKAGNITAQYLAGTWYLEHDEGKVETTFDEAIQWFDKAAANGHAKSQDIIAGEYLFGERNYSPEQKNTAVQYLILMANRGDSDAMDILLQIYGKGIVEGIDADRNKALEFAEKFAETGNLMSKMMIAQASDSSYIDDGDSRLADNKRAAALYQELVNSGDTDYIKIAAYNLGCMYIEGRGVTQSDSEAIRYLELAYENGEKDVAAPLLQYYLQGKYNEPDFVKRICQDVIGSNITELLPLAYYCQFRVADLNKQYRDSMAYARQYIACANGEETIKSELQKYLDDKEEQISNMSEEERMEFFHEKKPMFYDLKKDFREKNWKSILGNPKVILVIVIILGLVISAVFIIKNNVNTPDYTGEEYYWDDDTEEYSNDYDSGRFAGYENDFIFSDSDKTYLTESDVKYLSGEDTQQAINEIYARHGRIFKEEPYKSYFSACEWYEPTYTAEEFKDDVFNDYEKKNIQLLATHRDQVSVKITSEDAAIKYALDYCTKQHGAVDGAMCDGETARGYWIRGYNDMGTHITTMFNWEITTDGDIYEEDGTLVYEHP